MILPTKHITSPYSLLSLGALILGGLEEPSTVSRLWDRFRERREVATFQRFVLVLDLLFALGAVELENGLLRRQGP
jgi:hypothetical protein